MGNNQISDLKELLKLRGLTKLLIIQLAGNPICKIATYRPYVIFRLSSLQILDGEGIENDEQIAAQDMYSARLTVDYLEEFLGHRNFNTLKELSFPPGRIKEITLNSTELLNSLRHVVLEGNQLTGFGSLKFLPLNSLRLTNNKIERLDDLLLPENDGSLKRKTVLFATLQSLYLGSNNIRDIPALHLTLFSTLSYLNLENNDISKTEFTGPDSLKEVILDRNKLKMMDPSSFASLSGLRILSVEYFIIYSFSLILYRDCGLRVLNSFEPLQKIQVLRLGNNRIADLAELTVKILHF
jgi:Leucine-rich repeat (LRR) protein